MAIKDELNSSVDLLEWTVDTEVQLFHAMRGHKPVGVNRYFQMACIHEKFSNSLNREIFSQQIWNHLDTMYDLAALHESEILPFPNNESDFLLPNTEFGEMIKTRNGGVELPVAIRQETRVVRNETSTPEVRSKSGKEMSSRMKLENTNAPLRTPKPEPEPSPKAPTSGGKTFNFSATPKASRNESPITTPASRGGKDSSSKKSEPVQTTLKSSSKGTSKPESSTTSNSSTKSSKDVKGSSSATKTVKEGSSSSKSSKDSNKGSKESSSSTKNIKEGQRGGKDGSSSARYSKDSGKGGKDSGSSSKYVKGGKDSSSSSTKHLKDGHRSGKDSNTSKYLKDRHKDRRETSSRSSRDSDDISNSSRAKKLEKEDTNLRKRKRLSRQDAISKSNSPVLTPASKRRRT